MDGSHRRAEGVDGSDPFIDGWRGWMTGTAADDGENLAEKAAFILDRFFVRGLVSCVGLWGRPCAPGGCRPPDGQDQRHGIFFLA